MTEKGYQKLEMSFTGCSARFIISINFVNSYKFVRSNSGSGANFNKNIDENAIHWLFTL